MKFVLYLIYVIEVYLNSNKILLMFKWILKIVIIKIGSCIFGCVLLKLFKEDGWIRYVKC